MQLLTIDHSTVYRYRQPVSFGEHRLMLRPRDSHDLRLVESRLQITPRPNVRWLHDVFGNSIAMATFHDASDSLSLRSTIVVEHYDADSLEYSIEPFARTLPFSYAPNEISDLGRANESHYVDPEHRLDAWTRRFIGTNQNDTLSVLKAINSAIKDEFEYLGREEEGVLAPHETLERKAGSCRDFALLMMEAVRCLGLAARFVSGYLYDEAIDGQQSDYRGAGATHAWVQVYLPGAGWLEFDPTNGIVGGANLIRVGVARDPAQALPVQGSFFGATDAFLNVTVKVTVRAGATR